MALSRTEIQKRSDEKRGIVQKNFKLPSETVELIKTEAERRGGVASRADCLGGQVFCGGVKNGNGETVYGLVFNGLFSHLSASHSNSQNNLSLLLRRRSSMI